MWITRTNEYDSNKVNAKKTLYLNRGVKLINESKIDDWYMLITQIYNKNLDRDIVLDIALNALQLLSLGVDPKDVGEVVYNDTQKMIDCGAISPVEACMVRDLITEYNKIGLSFDEYCPEGTFLNSNHKVLNRKVSHKTK